MALPLREIAGRANVRGPELIGDRRVGEGGKKNLKEKREYSARSILLFVFPTNLR